MLNDVIEIFIGMFNYALELVGVEPSEFANYNYFVGVICCIVAMVIPAGAFALLITVVTETFKFIRGSIK